MNATRAIGHPKYQNYKALTEAVVEVVGLGEDLSTGPSARSPDSLVAGVSAVTSKLCLPLHDGPGEDWSSCP